MSSIPSTAKTCRNPHPSDHALPYGIICFDASMQCRKKKATPAPDNPVVGQFRRLIGHTGASIVPRLESATRNKRPPPIATIIT